MTPLKDIIQAQYLHKADTGESYTLSSGEKTDHYYDIKAMMGDYNHLTRLVSAMSHEIFTKRINFRSIGGTELGGVPLATSLQRNYHDVPVCFIRKTSRIHGMKRMIEGVIANPVLLIDDVINSTDTIRNAINTCTKEGFDVCGVLCVVNRSKSDNIIRFSQTYHINLAQQNDYPIHSLFTDADFGYGSN